MADELAVLVTVTGRDEEGSRVTLSTRGTLMDIPDGFMLRYEETSPDDLWATQTLVECRGGGVTIIRAGSMVSTIVYMENETFVSEYGTPLGQFTLRIFTTDVKARRRGAMGHVRLAYQVNLSSDLSPSGEMEMRWLDIRFKPCGSA